MRVRLDILGGRLGRGIVLRWWIVLFDLGRRGSWLFRGRFRRGVFLECSYSMSMSFEWALFTFSKSIRKDGTLNQLP